MVGDNSNNITTIKTTIGMITIKEVMTTKLTY
jgi:hypothetical protein